MEELIAIITVILLVIAWRVWQGSNHARQCADELSSVSKKLEAAERILDKLSDHVFDLRSIAKTYEAHMTAEDQRSLEEARRVELERRTAEKRQRIAEDQKRVAERWGRKGAIPLP
jgi:hypothetical protein